MMLLHVCDGDDVYNAMWFVPDPAISRKVPNHVDYCLPSVCMSCDGFGDGVDVDENFSIAEDINN